MSWDSVVGLTKIMINEGKGSGQHVSPVSSTIIIVAKHFILPNEQSQAKILQKNTWATIMSQDDKTCIIAYLLPNMH